MATKLSSEVTATTGLPAPSNVSATVISTSEISVSWTNNDDSPDGEIIVERSTDGFATVTTVASGLSPPTASFNDSTAPTGEPVEYRVERTTDHATATSDPSPAVGVATATAVESNGSGVGGRATGVVGGATASTSASVGNSQFTADGAFDGGRISTVASIVGSQQLTTTGKALTQSATAVVGSAAFIGSLSRTVQSSAIIEGGAVSGVIELNATGNDTDTGTAILPLDLAAVADADDTDTAVATASLSVTLNSAGSDADTSSATITLIPSITLNSAGSDADTSAATITTAFRLSGVGTDTDTGGALPELLIRLTASANDTDTATTTPFFLINVVGVTDPVEAVEEILRLSKSTATTQFTVKNWWEDAQSERGPGAGQPPVAYVWSPTGSTLDRFSIDANRFNQTDTIEVQVWSLDAREAKLLQQDITEILSRYLDDNNERTEFVDVAPVVENDFRQQNPARDTEHYVLSVEVETRGLSPTGRR